MPPKKWMPLEIALTVSAVVLLLIKRVALEGALDAVFSVVGLLLLAAAIVGRFVFWKCPACGKLLPTHAVTIRDCPYCGKPLGEKRT